MVEEETTIELELHDNFYRDSFTKVIFLLFSILVSMTVLVLLSVYFYTNKPPPITFFVDDEMRVQPAISLDQPYLSDSDVLQWVADVILKSFTVDFNHYNQQLKEYSQYFTPEGWTAFSNQLNVNVNYNTVQANKLFVTASPGAAPYLINEGIIPETGKYGWKVQMPVTINYTGLKSIQGVNLVLQILIVRTSTLNNLTGIIIDDVIQAPAATS